MAFLRAGFFLQPSASTNGPASVLQLLRKCDFFLLVYENPSLSFGVHLGCKIEALANDSERKENKNTKLTKQLNDHVFSLLNHVALR